MKRRDGAIAQLASDGPPRWVGIDYGSDGMTTECEVEFLPNGVMRVLDIRQTPEPKSKQERDDANGSRNG